MADNERFPTKERLRLKRDFDRAYGARRKATDGSLVVYVVENGLKWARIGIVTSKRIGPAVTRNYTRRRLREAFRRNKRLFPPGLDALFVAIRAIRRGEEGLPARMADLVRRAERKPGRPGLGGRTS